MKKHFGTTTNFGNGATGRTSRRKNDTRDTLETRSKASQKKYDARDAFATRSKSSQKRYAPAGSRFVKKIPKPLADAKNTPLPKTPDRKIPPVTVKSGNEIVYGTNAVNAIFLTGRRRVFRLFCKPEKEHVAQDAILRFPRLKHITPTFATGEELSEMTGSDGHQGIAVECAKFPFKDADALWEAAKTASCFIALDELQDPQNVGAIIRSGVFFGIHGIIGTINKNSPINATVAKTSAGNLERTEIYQVGNLARTLRRLKDSGFWIVGTDKTGDDLRSIRVPDKFVLVLGNEGKGMRRITTEHCDFSVSIAGNSDVESLNVSAACSVLLYQLTREGSNGH